MTNVAGTGITILSQEIFENDPRTRVDNLKVTPKVDSKLYIIFKSFEVTDDCAENYD